MVLNTDITGTQIGILQNAKNWRYGGSGWAQVLGSRVEDNVLDYASDGPARLTATITGGDSAAYGLLR